MQARQSPFRILHTADIHLEARFSGLPANKRQQRRLGLRDTFVRLIDEAVKNQVDAVIIAGDLFDNPQPSADTFHFVLAQFDRIAEIPILVIPGNHDYFADDSIFGQASFPENVHVFKEDNWESFTLPGNGIIFLGIACHAFSSQRNVLAEIDTRAQAGQVVAILHGSLNYGFYGGEQCYPFLPDDLRGLGAAYLALGHYHNFAVDGTNEFARYPGSPEGLKFSEAGPRKALLVDVNGRDTKVRELAVNSFVYDRLSLDCTMFKTSDHVRQAIKKLASAKGLLQVELVGTPDLDFDLNFSAEDLKEDFFYLEVLDKLALPQEIGDDDTNTIKNLFLKRMTARLSGATDEEERQELNLAIRLGLAALDGRLK